LPASDFENGNAPSERANQTTVCSEPAHGGFFGRLDGVSEMKNDKNDVDADALRESFRKIFDGVFAPKPKKPRDLNLRANPSQKPASATPDSKCR
jgi:hypothetical protein